MPRTSPRFRALVNASTAKASALEQAMGRAILIAALPLFCIVTTCVLPMVGMSTVRAKAVRVCDRARVGQPVAPLIVYGESLGLTASTSVAGPEHTLIGGRAHGSSCYCHLTHRDGVVISKRVWGHFPWQ
ncbi:MAG: hypothetical protein R3A52_14300 [Polyangiales bacterium]